MRALSIVIGTAAGMLAAYGGLVGADPFWLRPLVGLVVSFAVTYGLAALLHHGRR